MKATLHQGDVGAVFRQYAEATFHAALFDPPYGLSKPVTGKILAMLLLVWLVEAGLALLPEGWLQTSAKKLVGKGFKNRDWDSMVPSPKAFGELYRVLKPGGYAIVFAGDRTQHLMGISLALAGFEIRTTLPWLYSGGNPLKSSDMSKAIDRKLGKFDERPVTGSKKTNVGLQGGNYGTHSAVGEVETTGSATPQAAAWEGCGTALLPFYEPWILVQKPFKGGYADVALEHGTGGLLNGSGQDAGMAGNVIIDEHVAADLGELARFYQTASWDVRELYHGKAQRTERDAGCEDLPTRRFDRTNPGGIDKEPRYAPTQVKNHHDCVKPLGLLRYLARMILPPAPADGSPRLLAVPYCGSGSEVVGGLLAGWDEVVGIELDQTPQMEPDPDREGKERKVKDAEGNEVMVEAGFCDIAAARVRYWTREELGQEVEVTVHKVAPVEAPPPAAPAQLALF